jgi:hypothetical protein
MFPVAAEAGLSVVPVSETVSERLPSQAAFVVHNDGMTPALFRVRVQEVGLLLLGQGSYSSVLSAEPSEILLRPGEQQTVMLKAVQPLNRTRDFQVHVEQAPVLFSAPGQNRRPRDMTIHRTILTYTVAGKEDAVSHAANGDAEGRQVLWR